MNTLHLPKLLLLSATLLISSVTFAADNKPNFAFDASVGYLSDSNVGVADLDTNSGSSDTATSYDFAIKASVHLSQRFVSRFGYDYRDTAYQNLDQFDLGLHHLFAELTWKPSLLDASMNAETFKAMLDGDDYLDLAQITPSISRLIEKRVFLRGAFTHADKHFAGIPGRDASNVTWRADVYMLIDNMDRYISVGYQSGREDADDEAYDYRSRRWSMNYSQTFAFVSRDMKLKAGLNYEGRRYAVEDEAIGGYRQDMRLRLRVGADWNVFEHVSLAAHVEYTDIRSNLESAALNKTVFGLEVKAAF